MAKFEIDFLEDYTDNALLNEIRRVATLLPDGGPLTRRAYQDKNPRVATSTICRRFGGWKEALELAGLGPRYSGRAVTRKMKLQPAKKLSNADLIEEMNRVHRLVGKDWLTSEDFNALSLTSEDTIRSRFGSFPKGLLAAEIPSHRGKPREFTDQECFQNTADVWVRHGRAPQFREMFREPSLIRGKTYVLRWGTWRKALKAFVDWANSEEGAHAPEQPMAAPPRSLETSRADARPPSSQADNREVPPGLRFKVFMRDRFRCVACGRSPALDLGVILHADHIRAVANGGKTILENLQTLCQSCNLGKGRMTLPGAPS